MLGAILSFFQHLCIYMEWRKFDYFLLNYLLQVEKSHWGFDWRNEVRFEDSRLKDRELFKQWELLLIVGLWNYN